MEDLLALRANEGSVWARKHIEDCGICRGELDAMYQRVAQLKALPALRPSRDRWPVVRDKLRANRTAKRRRTMAGLGSLAAAAALATVFVASPFGGPSTVQADLLDAFKEQSATLESRLARHDLASRVMSGWEAALAAEIEDRIAVIDGQLVERGVPAPQPAVEVVNLWRQRVNLMERLYTVRSAAYQGM